ARHDPRHPGHDACRSHRCVWLRAPAHALARPPRAQLGHLPARLVHVVLAHASIVTGRRRSSHGATSGLAKEHPPLGSETSPEFLAASLPYPLDESATTLAEILAARGYATAA